MKPRVLVLRAAGTNCDRETEWAFRLAGGDPQRVHINEFVSGRRRMGDYHVLAIPGGFSYGDDIAAGKVLANELRFKIWDQVERFIRAGKPVIGICNGFQVLVKCGLLPATGRQTATLCWNDSGRFEDRWVHLRVEESRCPFLRGLPETVRLPVAHAEGKFVPGSRAVLNRIERNRQVAFRYCLPSGGPGGYPANPNGSVNDIAGICNETGLILGMMPHPERCLLREHLPDWTRNPGAGPYGFGFAIFRNMIEYVL